MTDSNFSIFTPEQLRDLTAAITPSFADYIVGDTTTMPPPMPRPRPPIPELSELVASLESAGPERAMKFLVVKPAAKKSHNLSNAILANATIAYQNYRFNLPDQSGTIRFEPTT